MSQKWIRTKKWDDQHLTGALLPVKFVLRLFSSVLFGVSMLVLVALYGILASVPIGLIALAPTWVLYGLSLAASVALIAALPAWLGAAAVGRAGVPVGARFVIGIIGGVALTVLAVIVWHRFAWPVLRYDPVTHSGGGVRFFGAFVDQYKTMQFRRLPIMEMSELEFYAWWPLRVILITFVTTMVVATLRRIEFSFPYIGVITVHTGIVTIALGSIYYASRKQEGDMLLEAGPIAADGTPAPGKPETGFYDNTRTALWVSQPGRVPPTSAADPQAAGAWDQRRLTGVPRYHEYNTNALGLKNLPPIMAGALAHDQGVLSIDVPESAAPPPQAAPIDSDIQFRIVGYAPYAELVTRLVRAADIDAAKLGNAPPESVRTVEAYLNIPPDPADPEAADPSKPRKVWRFMPDSPAKRVDLLSVEDQALLGVEYTRGMNRQRWKDLAVSLPRGTKHALVVRHPASGFESVYPVQRGSRIAVGDTGYQLEVEELSSEPPFPIVTKGYQGGRSSVAIVHVQPPPPAPDQPAAPAYQRWVYHRFPEISQDLVDAPADAPTPPDQPPMSRRRNADPGLEISYIDTSIIQIYLDEQPVPAGATGSAAPVRALVRLPGGGATVTPTVADGGAVEITPGFSIKLGERIDDALRVEFPVPIPESDRDSRVLGTHRRAAVAVEVTAAAAPPFRTTLWVPFSQYLDPSGHNSRLVTLPDGRAIRSAFGRVRHEFWPPMALRLADFEMTPYPHSQTPRDYKSDLIVMRRWSTRHEDVRRKTSLNEPLLERTPFQPRDDVPGVINAIGWLFSKVAPNQYKFSQAGWDQDGWMQSLADVQKGEIKRPFARYTILGVGNNPGIYIIAAGAVMMSVGIPWAFYFKPWIMQRRKRKIQQQLAAGTCAGRNGTLVPHAATPPQQTTHPPASVQP